MSSLLNPTIIEKGELATLGRNISSARQRQNLSQIELSRRSGLHRTYLSDVERGRRNLGFLSVVAIARGLGMTVAELTREVESTAHVPATPVEDFQPAPLA